MTAAILVDREGNRAHLVPTGSFDLAHVTAASKAVQNVEANLNGCVSVDVDLARLDRIDGSGAVLLAHLFDRLAEDECDTVIIGNRDREARLIGRYRASRKNVPRPQQNVSGPLEQLDALTNGAVLKANAAFDFAGRCVAAVPGAAAAPSSIDWHSLPRLVQEVGADALPVTCAANLLVGVIIGFLGISQLAPLGGIAYVPGLVVVAHFRELGPLVTAIIVAGRSGAGLASEIATMKVSEEIDALRSLGFDPVKWLILPRCLALAVTLPLLTWIGDVLGLIGGVTATILMTNMTFHSYVELTTSHITAAHLLVGLVKSPFLAVAIGLIACGTGLSTQGGAAAVGSRTTTAVVLSIFSVIGISAVITFFFALIGI